MVIPCDAPKFAVNRWSIQGFNFLYYWRQQEKFEKRLMTFDQFFYPLDGVLEWNRIYGKRGFFQYQCVLPYEGDAKPLRSVLKEIADSGAGSFLTVLKMFGDVVSPGVLSFPKKGVTLAIDLPNQGSGTLDVMNRLDEIVQSVRGAVYPAKDARMSAESFRNFFPQWENFSKFKDPRFSSSFWRRVTCERSSS